MSKILFASNNIVDFNGSVTSVLSATYDNTRVPYSIDIDEGVFSRSPEFEPSTTEDTWVHFTMLSNYVILTAGVIFKLYDANNDIIFKLEMITDGSWKIQATIYRDGVGTISNDLFTLLNNAKHTFDVKHTVSALSSSTEVYWNRILILSGNSLTADADPLSAKSIELYAMTRGLFFSELFLSDGDTRNGRMNLLAPTAVGNYSDWDGLVSTLIDGDGTTGMTTKLANQNLSLSLSAYTGSVNISNIVISSSAIKGSGAPTNLQHFIRGSGIDHLGDIFAVTDVLSAQISDSEINPTTSLPWVASDLATVEIGFKSLT